MFARTRLGTASATEVAADLGGDIFHLYRCTPCRRSSSSIPTAASGSIVNGPLDEARAAAHVEAILPKGG